MSERKKKKERKETRIEPTELLFITCCTFVWAYVISQVSSYFF